MGKKIDRPMSRHGKVLAGVICAVIMLAFLCWGLHRILSDAPPPVEEITDQETAVEVLTESDLSKLSQEEKLAYAEKMRELRPWELTRARDRSGENTAGKGAPKIELTEEQRKLLRNNARAVFGAIMNQRADAYAALPQDQRVAYLDSMIDEIEARRKEHEARRAERGEEESREQPPPEKEGDGDKPDRKQRMMSRMKERIETTDPEERAKHMQLFKDMRARMEERGIKPLGRGPGGHR